MLPDETAYVASALVGLQLRECPRECLQSRLNFREQLRGQSALVGVFQLRECRPEHDSDCASATLTLVLRARVPLDGREFLAAELRELLAARLSCSLPLSRSSVP